MRGRRRPQGGQRTTGFSPDSHCRRWCFTARSRRPTPECAYEEPGGNRDVTVHIGTYVAHLLCVRVSVDLIHSWAGRSAGAAGLRDIVSARTNQFSGSKVARPPPRRTLRTLLRALGRRGGVWAMTPSRTDGRSPELPDVRVVGWEPGWCPVPGDGSNLRSSGDCRAIGGTNGDARRWRDVPGTGGRTSTVSRNNSGRHRD